MEVVVVVIDVVFGVVVFDVVFGVEWWCLGWGGGVCCGVVVGGGWGNSAAPECQYSIHTIFYTSAYFRMAG